MDIAKVREFLAAREEDRKVALHSRWLRARSDFDRIVARIVED